MAPILLTGISAIASLPLSLRLEDRRHTCLPQRFFKKFAEDSQYDSGHARSSRYDTDTSGGEDDDDEVMVTEDDEVMVTEDELSTINTAPLPSALVQVCTLSSDRFLVYN